MKIVEEKEKETEKNNAQVCVCENRNTNRSKVDFLLLFLGERSTPLGLFIFHQYVS